MEEQNNLIQEEQCSNKNNAIKEKIFKYSSLVLSYFWGKSQDRALYSLCQL